MTKEKSFVVALHIFGLINLIFEIEINDLPSVFSPLNQG
jgi:hypothetical protein